MEIQYLGGCDIQWKNNDSVGGSARSGAVGGSQSSSDTDVLSLLQDKGGLNQAQREEMLLHAALENSKKDTSSSSAEKSVQDAAAATADGGGSNNDGGKGGGGGDGDGDESGDDNEGEGGESSMGTQASQQVIVSQARADASAASQNHSDDLFDIAKWDHRSGTFPLTDRALQQMTFDETKRPKYYFAAALILFMRSSHTPKEEEVLQVLREKWRDWFGVELSYEALKAGPPQVGACAYTPAERNWCEVRMEELDKAIKEDDTRVAMGLPLKPGRKKQTARIISAQEKEQADLLVDDRAQAPTPRRPRQDETARKRSREEPPAAASASAAAAAASSISPRGTKRTLAALDRSVTSEIARVDKRAALMDHNVENGDDSEDSPVTTPAPKQRKRRRRSDKIANIQDSETSPGLHGTLAKRAALDANGRLVSKADGRALVCNNTLRKRFPSTYRNPHNTREWNGQHLDLGQGFKLAVWTHYGPSLPLDKNGHLPMRTALFRTAAYYALSMDGEEEQECIDSKDFPELLFIMVSAAKQMRYNLLVDARFYFGKHVFTEHRPDKDIQGEFENMKCMCTH